MENKTAEEVLNEVMEGFRNQPDDLEGHEYKPASLFILQAMKEFAQERSVGFAEWTAPKYKWDEWRKLWYSIYPSKNTGLTTSQLYQQFIEQLNKG